MARVLCPNCGREAVGLKGVWSGVKPHCTVCGWNVDRAIASERRNLKIVAIYLAGIAILFAASNLGTHHGWDPSSAGTMIFALVLAGGAFASWRRWRSLNSQRAAPTVAAASPPAAFRSQPKASSASFDSLFMLRRPRTLRLKTAPRIFIIASSIALVGVGYAAYQSAERSGFSGSNGNVAPNLISFAVFGLIWLGVGGRALRGVVRDRSLLTDGEIAIATVVSQSFSGDESRSRSKIVYEFKDAAGRTFSGKANDQTRTLFEEMQTPVFYEPTNPAKNVSLAGAAYDVVNS